MRCLLLLFPLALALPVHEEFKETEVIDLPIGRFPDPQCRYHVRLGNSTGSAVHGQVRVGEPLFHSWSCNYGQRSTNLYCVMVNKCTVADTRQRSNKIEIIDEFGCSLFPSILPHVTYSSDLDAGLGVNAFSLDIDETAVFFECNIKMLLKLNGVCRRPTCQPLEVFQRGGDARLVRK